MADRLESEAQNELYLFLAQVCRLGFHKLLIYPLRPPTPVHARRPRSPTTTRRRSNGMGRPGAARSLARP